jgi:Flp pilus assembly pilin Flp
MMKKGLLIALVAVVVIIVVGTIGVNFMPTVDGALPRPGG